MRILHSPSRWARLKTPQKSVHALRQNTPGTKGKRQMGGGKGVSGRTGRPSACVGAGGGVAVSGLVLHIVIICANGRNCSGY